MKKIIAGEDAALSNLARQQAFFSAHLQPWAAPMCKTLGAHPKARFYAALAAFLAAFAEVETQGFDMLDS